MRLVLTAVLALAAACTPPARNAPPSTARPDSVPFAGTLPQRGDTVTVQALAAEPARHAGRTVAVRGRCLGWNGPAPGSGPLTRSDWQLGDGGQAVWVSGPYPPGCTGQGGGELTFRGRVAMDTITIRGTGERRQRAYLVRPE